MYCMLVGALISPTHPIAVMGILRSAGAPKNLELVIAGESLVNDGVGVVIFALLLGVLVSGTAPTPEAAGALLPREAGGSIAFGLGVAASTSAWDRATSPSTCCGASIHIRWKCC